MPSSPLRPPERAAPTQPPGLTRLNTLATPEALDLLREVCASPRWASGIIAGRPYPDAEALLSANDTITASLTVEDLSDALAGHPPIGRPTPADPVSAREQRGMGEASDDLRAEMGELNLAYQKRFGHVFLICATGLSGEQLRDALRARLANDREREHQVVRAELGRINRLRFLRLTAGH
ncbi:2-oxo-4-hydroxy-4-carboxy-5-ureidoimidazoline decarboxylase [Streptomyces sp. NPDC056500]|uniref:2-oxo-4-hydroxy-4-carboxy-5-ureidoimidazoline decarboxylase n=1 Tax=Streptomyces sp. NPDC056500 TaxID=3345840 RepID=UPI00369F442B